jgi:hypothetical protein
VFAQRGANAHRIRLGRGLVGMNSPKHRHTLTYPLAGLALILAAIGQPMPGLAQKTASAPIAPTPAPPPTNEPTVSKTEFYKALAPYNSREADDSTDMHARASGSGFQDSVSHYVSNRDENVRDMHYEWLYAHWDHHAHKPVPLMTGINGRDDRIEDIQPVRTECVKVVSKMDEEDQTIPQRIPVSQVDNYQDQWAEMVTGCVNHELEHMIGMKDVIAIMCFQDNKHCIGPVEYPDRKPDAPIQGDAQKASPSTASPLIGNAAKH